MKDRPEDNISHDKIGYNTDKDNYPKYRQISKGSIKIWADVVKQSVHTLIYNKYNED